MTGYVKLVDKRGVAIFDNLTTDEVAEINAETMARFANEDNFLGFLATVEVGAAVSEMLADYDQTKTAGLRQKKLANGDTITLEMSKEGALL